MDLEPAFAAWFVVTRWLHMSACLLLLGTWAFDRWVVAPVARPEPESALALRWRSIAGWLVLPSLLVAIVSGVAWFVLVAMNMSDEPFTASVQPEVLKLVAQTDFGHAWALHFILLAIATIATVVWWLVPTGLWRSTAGWLNGVTAAGVTAGIAWAGHGATGPAPSWHRAADVLHLLIAAVWPAGLLPLALLLMRLRRSRAVNPNWCHQALAIVRRFSALSVISVALLIATGTINAWCLVGSVPAFWTSAYGRCLLIKLALLAAMLGLGANNLFILKPRLAVAAASSEPQPQATAKIAGRLALCVALELLLAMLVIAVVGVLGLMAPARM